MYIESLTQNYNASTNQYLHIFIFFRIKENLKKMFDGDKFWNFCEGVWEKSISLKIAFFFMKLLAFFLPFMSIYLGFIILRRETTIYEDRDAMNACHKLGFWDNSEEGSQCRFQEKLHWGWLLTFFLIWTWHTCGGCFYALTFEEHMEDLRIKYLRANLILILGLIGLQTYVSYIPYF